MGQGVEPGSRLRAGKGGLGQLSPIQAAPLVDELGAELGGNAPNQRRPLGREPMCDLVGVNDGRPALTEELGR